ncbi:hypothetical protein BABA_11571 [Neobacillus bataviensis LMG 21833]|uniref:Uncharacterized protein n=1 Tax=Neobacillus bataviensis LMG 21833 TaxID=1117379 RepID=K6E715_9BACI|nr:hypothetical protein BABA_11571 [Neobacillus bataviensis LMG 21833]
MDKTSRIWMKMSNRKILMDKTSRIWMKMSDRKVLMDKTSRIWMKMSNRTLLHSSFLDLDSKEKQISKYFNKLLQEN